MWLKKSEDTWNVWLTNLTKEQVVFKRQQPQRVNIQTKKWKGHVEEPLDYFIS